MSDDVVVGDSVEPGSLLGDQEFESNHAISRRLLDQVRLEVAIDDDQAIQLAQGYALLAVAEMVSGALLLGAQDD